MTIGLNYGFFYLADSSIVYECNPLNDILILWN